MHQVNDTQKYSFPACTLGDLPAAPFFEHFSTQYYCLLRNVDPSQEATDQIGYIRELNQDALKRGACQLKEDILHLLAFVHPIFRQTVSIEQKINALSKYMYKALEGLPLLV